MDTTTGFKVAPLGGGTARLGVTTTRHGGAGALKVDYAFTSSSTGFELVRNLVVPGTPSTVSVWVCGDGSANPVYLKVADKTGGKYYRADSTDTLRKIYAEIDQLEKSEAVVKKYVQREELFRWVAIPGLLLLLLEISLANTVWRRLP